MLGLEFEAVYFTFNLLYKVKNIKSFDYVLYSHPKVVQLRSFETNPIIAIVSFAFNTVFPPSTSDASRRCSIIFKYYIYIYSNKHLSNK